MWNVSEKIGTPEQAENLKRFLKDKPGKEPVPARQLPKGDRFTAVGRFNVDVEYYIASPPDTERWTMRWGQKYVDYGVVGEDYRDLLQLRLAGDGDYVVVMFPRFRKEAAPRFTTVAGGRVIFSGWQEDFGRLIEIDHGDGLITRYGHNQENLVQLGEVVQAGQIIGRVGQSGLTTGPHLHFEVRRDDQPLDPVALLNAEGIRRARTEPGADQG